MVRFHKKNYAAATTEYCLLRTRWTGVWENKVLQKKLQLTPATPVSTKFIRVKKYVRRSLWPKPWFLMNLLLTVPYLLLQSLEVKTLYPPYDMLVQDRRQKLVGRNSRTEQLRRLHVEKLLISKWQETTRHCWVIM